MCYMTIISTTSELDLCRFNSSDLIFDKELPGLPEEELLKYPHKWYVGSADGCSCGFRHLMSGNFERLGFGEPEEWFPEDPEDIEATLKLVETFEYITRNGERLQCIDVWCDGDISSPKSLSDLVVDLSVLPKAAFRLIEGYSQEIIFKS